MPTSDVDAKSNPSPTLMPAGLGPTSATDVASSVVVVVIIIVRSAVAASSPVHF